MRARDAIFAALGAIAPAGNAPIGSSPAGNTPVGNTPVGNTPRGAEIDRDAAALLDRVPGLRPDRVPGDPVQAFVDRLTGPVISATVTRVAALTEVPNAVRDYLGANALPDRVALQPHDKLLPLDWSGIDTHRDIAVDEAVSVGIAAYAVAETGSLVFRSGSDMPVLFAFLPMHHLAVVEAASIVAWLEDCAAIEAARPAPRNLILITGASGTTDIEGALVRGAHGPGHLHIILVQPNNL